MNLQLDPRPFESAKDYRTGDGAYAPVSFWQETIDAAPGEALEGEHACDVAIAGGGFTGLSAAIALKQLRPDLDIHVVERAIAGHGASGRNGGFAMPLIGWDLAYCVDKLGEAEAGKAYRVMYDAVDHLKRFVAEHGIDCDLEATGYLLINTCSAREARAKRELAAAHRLGFEHEWLDAEALRGYIRSETFRSGVFDPRPCVINPAKLARGLKRAAEALGVRVHEQTPVTSLEEGPETVLRTPRGALKARTALLALNGYGGALGFMKARILPVHTYIVLTEPLTAAQLEEIGWGQKRASLETARNFIHYFRLTADNRILFGGEDADLYWGGAFRDHDERIFESLRQRFRAYFPSLDQAAFTHAWGGVLGVTFDMFPSFGQGGEHKNIFHAAGYSGHGVALSNYAGALLAPAILARLGIPVETPRDLPFFFHRKPAWLPPDPLRFAGMRGYRAILRAQDKWQGA